MISQERDLPALPSHDKKALKAVEEKYAASVLAGRIRLSEIFYGFDPMRTGKMTTSQFVRCVSNTKGANLYKHEIDALIEGYAAEPAADGIKENKVRWRDFVTTIDKVFGVVWNDVTGKPEDSDAANTGGFPYRKPVSEETEVKLKDIIARMKQFKAWHGSDPKNWFADFDKGKKGWVNQNQFRRGLPQNLITVEEEDMIMERYGDSASLTVNYLKLNIDVTRKNRKAVSNEQQLVQKPEHEERKTRTIGTEEILHRNHYETINNIPIVVDTKKLALSAEEEIQLEVILSKLAKIVKERRILLAPLFKDFDKSLGTFNRVTKSQFSRVLSSSEITIPKEELYLLFKKFEDQKEGRINYMEFIRLVDPEDRVQIIRRSDTTIPTAPKQKSTHERDYKDVIEEIQNYATEQRMRVMDGFKDFDKLRAYSIRTNDFVRGLYGIGVSLTSADVDMIVKQYKDEHRSGFCKWKEFTNEVEKHDFEIVLN